MRVLSFICGILLVAVTFFGLGMWAHEKNWSVWVFVDRVRDGVRSMRATGHLMPYLSYGRRVNPDAPVYEVHHPDRIASGYLLLNRYEPSGPGFETLLLDSEGEVLHTWPINYSRIVEGGNPGEFAHALLPFPDGSILVNFDDGHAMARLDVCGNPIWKREDFTFHHSFAVDEVAGVWTWAAVGYDGTFDQHMLRFDPDTGETLESISLLRDVLGREETRLESTFPEAFNFDEQVRAANTDYLHPNDLEPLSIEMAAAFPMFEPGDLLVSWRNTHLVGVIDREDHGLKWFAYGPWRNQHDPDFLPDGTIAVYSNNIDRFRSTVVVVNPATGEVQDRFYGSELDFDSAIMGKMSQLPNGNWLIVSATEGRVIEVAENGEILREYNNRLNEAYNALITDAHLLPPDFYDSLPNCDGQS